mmetsp:Transcript_41841/g.103207  ORF Transcript_41841/g.103207 Transcript_41841/m.103207 type:complete len:312 (+) Transcript_41841:129-1064(+)
MTGAKRSSPGLPFFTGAATISSTQPHDGDPRSPCVSISCSGTEQLSGSPKILENAAFGFIVKAGSLGRLCGPPMGLTVRSLTACEDSQAHLAACVWLSAPWLSVRSVCTRTIRSLGATSRSFWVKTSREAHGRTSTSLPPSNERSTPKGNGRMIARTSPSLSKGASFDASASLISVAMALTTLVAKLWRLSRARRLSRTISASTLTMSSLWRSKSSIVTLSAGRTSTFGMLPPARSSIIPSANPECNISAFCVPRWSCNPSISSLRLSGAVRPASSSSSNCSKLFSTTSCPVVYLSDRATLSAIARTRFGS